MLQPIFITGIGTDIGKTVVSAVVVGALDADYWKPVQAGFADGTDSGRIKNIVSGSSTVIHPELYKLKMPASPHIAARSEGIRIDPDKIKDYYESIKTNSPNAKQLVIEGAGGIYVPLNNDEFVIDLIKKLNARVILVSRNYLGSINHSLLTAEVCKVNKVDVIGWIFNGDYMEYEHEIAEWTSYPIIGKIPQLEKITKETICDQSVLMKKRLIELL